MWTSWIKGGIGLVALVFMMWMLRVVLDPILNIATEGDHASEPVVQEVAGYFAALTLDNLTVIAVLAVGIYLFGRAAVERRLTG